MAYPFRLRKRCCRTNHKGNKKGADPEGEFEMIMTTNHSNVDCAANSELYSFKESKLQKNRRKGGKKKPEGHFYIENIKAA